MLSQELIKRIKLVRRDLGNLLFHFTQTPRSNVVIKSEKYERNLTKSALSVLEKILSEGKLYGSSKKIRGGFKCICFTESPISEIASLFLLENIAKKSDEKTRYEPYGIAVRKEWLFSKGGRPVIYEPEAEFELLPEVLQYRHVRYDDPDSEKDYTWEREWRIKTDCLVLDPKQTLVVVPDAETAFDLAFEHAKFEWDLDYPGGEPIGSYPVAKWMTVSLDLFGLKMK